MGSLSLWHWIIVLLVVLLLFGSGKISGLMGDVAKGIKAFKAGMREEDETVVEPQKLKAESVGAPQGPRTEQKNEAPHS